MNICNRISQFRILDYKLHGELGYQRYVTKSLLFSFEKRQVQFGLRNEIIYSHTNLYFAFVYYLLHIIPCCPDCPPNVWSIGDNGTT